MIRALHDAWAIAGRYLIAYRRVPQLLVFSTIQPVIFVLMFRYVFGGAIQVPNGAYVDFLMPGIFVQTVVFGALGSSIGLAADVKSGLLERFRSLPMARSALLLGRTFADTIRNVFVVILMTAVGFAVGFRLHNGVLAYLAGVAVVLAFGYALSWIFATVGLAVGDPETSQAAAFPMIAPFVFASSAFVPVQTMPGWLQVFAEHQPVSVTAGTLRALVLGDPVAWQFQQSIGWSLLIVLIFAPLAVLRYRKTL